MKIIYLIISIALFASCKGEKGDIGPQGIQGTPGINGKNGTTGTAGSAGQIGQTGEQGEPGVVGPQGATPSVNFYYTNWETISNWKIGSSTNSIRYNFTNSYKITFIPNYTEITLNYFQALESFVAYNKLTKEPVGNFYVFNKITNNGEDVVFNTNYEGGKFNFKSSNTSFIATTSDFKIIPTLDANLTVDFSNNYFKSTDNFDTLLSNLNTKIRFVFIPIGLPSKSGRKASQIKSYSELIKEYNIPE